MAHIRPINQPWVDIPSWMLARPEEKQARVTLTYLGLFIRTLD